MSDLQQALEILLGQKIRDEVTGFWHVYDANGNEISDPGGILLRANPGALLAWPNAVVEEIVQQAGGGHWRHLLRPIKAVETPQLRLRGASRCRAAPPEVFRIKRSADAPLVSLQCGVRPNVLTPVIGVRVPGVSARGAAVLRVRRPRSGASGGFLRYSVGAYGHAEVPSCGCWVPPLRGSSRSYYTFTRPQTIQNPTDEMLLELIR